ncbi:hypothetical protein GCM10023065_31890 [Microbacterium laevaniformans]|uniref:hypothetical protein n=1 Tax=Microbacterium laevaniformans TaxID=36807 RepID=UPI0031E7B65B
MAQRNAPAFLGGIGIVSTFVALWSQRSSPAPDSPSASRGWTWIVAPMIVWVVTANRGVPAAAVLLKKKVQDRRES